MMFTIEVVLYATLGKYNPEGSGSKPFFFRVEAGIDVEGLLAALGIPPGESKQAYIKNRRVEYGHLLKDGERVAVFPPIAGG